MVAPVMGVRNRLHARRTEDSDNSLNYKLMLHQRNGNYRILLADDVLLNQKLVSVLLSAKGHTVVVVDDGRKAVDRFRAEAFDLILMDVQMPVLNGFQATAAIRAAEKATGRHTPIIAMTAHAMAGDRQRCLEAGMDEYISKPINPAELQRIMQTLFPADNRQPTVIHAEAAGLDELVQEYGADLTEQLIGVFLETVPRQLREMRAAWTRGEWESIARSSHSLISATGNLRATALEQLCRRLEGLAKEQRRADIESALGEFTVELRRVEQMMRQYLEKQKRQQAG